MNGDILNAKKFFKNTNCMLINVNLDKHHFDTFTEIIMIKNSLFNVTKIKLTQKEKLITRLSSKIKEIHCTLSDLNC